MYSLRKDPEHMTKAELIDVINRIKRIIYPCREIVDEYLNKRHWRSSNEPFPTY